MIVQHRRQAKAPAGPAIRQDLHDAALHCLIVEGRVHRSDFYRFGFAHQDILAYGLEALVTARLDHACRRAGAVS